MLKESEKLRIKMKAEMFSDEYQNWLNMRARFSINTLSTEENILLDTAHELIHKVLELNIRHSVRLLKD